MIIGCYTRPSLQADVKNVSMFQKMFVLFCPVKDIISVEKHHPFTPRPVRDKMFLLHITSLTGLWSPAEFSFLPICCP